MQKVLDILWAQNQSCNIAYTFEAFINKIYFPIKAKNEVFFPWIVEFIDKTVIVGEILFLNAF